MHTTSQMDEFKIGHIITGGIAGAMALVFNKYPRTKREKIKAFAIVFGGAISTAFLTPLALLYLPVLQNAEYGVAFIIGLFGMGVLEAVYKVVQALIEDPYGTIVKLKNAFRGKSE